MRRLPFAASILLLAAACSDVPDAVSGPQVDGALLSHYHLSDPAVLTGTITYWTYAPEIRTLLQDATFTVPTAGTTTTFEFLDGNRVRLQLHEDHSASGEGDRWTTLEGTLEHNGELTLDYVGLPEWAPGVPFLVGMVQWHSGCTITGGDFPTYHGRFNGEKLVAETRFTSVCPGPSGTPDAPLFPTPVLGPDGTLTPVDWAWKLDLQVHGQGSSHRDVQVH